LKGAVVTLDYTDIEHTNNIGKLDELSQTASSTFKNKYKDDWNTFNRRFTSKKSVWEFAHNYLSLDISLDTYYYRNTNKDLDECIDLLLVPTNLRAISALLGINDPSLMKLLSEYEVLHDKVQRKEYNDAYARYRMKR